MSQPELAPDLRFGLLWHLRNRARHDRHDRLRSWFSLRVHVLVMVERIVWLILCVGVLVLSSLGNITYFIACL